MSIDLHETFVSFTYACDHGLFGTHGVDVVYHCENFYADPLSYTMGACVRGEGHIYELKYVSDATCDPRIENRTTDEFWSLRAEVEIEVCP